MADRSTGWVRVHADVMPLLGLAASKDVENIDGAWDVENPACFPAEPQNIIVLQGNDFPGGILEDLESFLKKRKIPFDAEWEGFSGSYDAGSSYFRFNEKGEMLPAIVCLEGQGSISYRDLLAMVEEKGVDALLDHAEKMKIKTFPAVALQDAPLPNIQRLMDEIEKGE